MFVGQNLANLNVNNNTATNNFFRHFNQNLYTTTVPPSLSINQFGHAVKEMRLNQMPVYIQSYIVSEKPEFTQAQKTEALSLLMEVISEIHSPMLISQTGKKRGNTTRVKFEGRKTTLRNVWDSLLLAKQGLAAAQLANALDTATAAQVAQWQTGDPNDWLFESYQIGTQIYDDMRSRRKLNNDYYEQHISTINRRIYMAGIRLAGVLNRMFKVYTTLKERMVEVGGDLLYDDEKEGIAFYNAFDLRKNIGYTVSVEGKAYRCKLLGSAAALTINDRHSKQSIKIVLKGEAMKQARKLYGKNMIFTGRVSLYKGKPLVEVADEDGIVKSW